MIQIGYKAALEQYFPLELVEYAVKAEEEGFDFIEASDHFHPWSTYGQASFVWTWLGAVAVRTRRIRLGTGVTCPILRYDPAIVAQAVATLTSMAPDRVFLGVGTGEAINEYAVTGFWPGHAERQRMLAEALILMRSLWTGEETTFDGMYYQTRKAQIYTMSQEIIPVYISSLSPGSAYFAGMHGDGLFSVGGKEDAVYKEIIAHFDQGVKESGRDPANFPKCIELGVEFTKDTKDAVETRKKFWAGTFIPALFNEKIYTPLMSEENGAVVGKDTIMQRICISADPDEHVQFVKRYIDLGFNYLVFHSSQPDQSVFIENYAKHVVPLIRKLRKK